MVIRIKEIIINIVVVTECYVRTRLLMIIRKFNRNNYKNNYHLPF